MVGDKTRAIAETGAALVLAGDLGCLMNMAGKASREGRAFRARHVVEVLAGDLGTPAIGIRSEPERADLRGVRGERPAALATPTCRRRSGGAAGTS